MQIILGLFGRNTNILKVNVGCRGPSVLIIDRLPDKLPRMGRRITQAGLTKTETKLSAETGKAPVHVQDPAVLLHLGVLSGQQVVDHVVPEHEDQCNE